MPRQRPLGVHPSERPNWESMNEGQRRYAVEQYQLARLRRGLDIDHPNPITEPASEPELPELGDISAELEELERGHHNTNSQELGEILDGDYNQDDIDEIVRELDTGMGDVEMQNVSSSSGGTKRTGDSVPTSGSKKVRGGSRTTLPGRAGAEGGGGGVSGASEGVVEIPRPRNDDSFYTKHFIKQHKFFTFGFASKIISQAIAVSVPAGQYPAHTQYYMTSSLAQIPVHIPALYMNQSEYNLLRHGAHVKHIKVTVVQRNPVLQFETNASATQLATLNQNKNAIYSIGLNKTGYGVDRHYTSFSVSGEPMIPTAQGPPLYGSSTSPSYQGLVSDLYGVANNNTNFGTITPKHQFGMYTTLKNYWCTTTTSLSTSGWPNLQSKVKEWDAANTVGMPICEYEYTPKMGLLTNPQRAIWTGLPFVTDATYSHGTGNTAPEIIEKSVASFGNVSSLTYKQVAKSSNTTALNLYSPIEKSQYQSVGPSGTQQHQVQPSLHVGIMPAPALSSGSLTSDLSNSTFTDVRGYFDVTCEMTVGWREHTDRAFASSYNVAPGEEVYEHGTPIVQDSSVWANCLGSVTIPNE